MAYQKKDQGKDPSQEEDNRKEQPRQEQSSQPTVQTAFGVEGTLFPLTGTPGIGEPLGYGYKVDDGQYFRLPAIASIGFIPTFGRVVNAQDPLNTLAQKIFADVQNAMRKTSLGFTAADIILETMALGSVSMLYEAIKRAYCTLNTANIQSLYQPEVLMDAQGLDFKSFRENKADVLFWLVDWAATLRRYFFPKIMAAAQVHKEMCSYVFADAVSAKAQLYITRPEFIWSYANVDTERRLTAIPAMHSTTNVRTWAEVKDMMNDLINAFNASSGFQRINAALYSTYGDGEMYTCEPPAVTDMLSILHNPAFLNTLMNATVYSLREEGGTSDDITFAQTFAPQEIEATGYLRCTPKVPRYERHVFARIQPLHVFNSLIDVPTASDMTRMAMWHADIVLGDANTLEVMSCGTEFITAITVLTLQNHTETSTADSDKVFYYTSDGARRGVGENVSFYTRMAVDVASLANSNAEFQRLCAMSLTGSFKWFPPILFTVINTVGDDAGAWRNTTTTVFAQWNYSAAVSRDDIYKYHRALLTHYLG